MNANEACLVGHMLYKNVYLQSKMERRASTAPQIQFPEMIPTTPMLLQLSQKYTTTTYTLLQRFSHMACYCQTNILYQEKTNNSQNSSTNDCRQQKTTTKVTTIKTDELQGEMDII